MANKTSNLNADDSWRLTRKEIAERARTVRRHLEKHRERLEGMPFDVVTADTPHSVDIPNALEPRDDASPLDLAESFNPCLAGQHDRLEKSLPADADLDSQICTMKMETADTPTLSCSTDL